MNRLYICFLSVPSHPLAENMMFESRQWRHQASGQIRHSSNIDFVRRQPESVWCVHKLLPIAVVEADRHIRDEMYVSIYNTII